MMGLRLLYRDWRGGDVTVLLVALALAVAIVTGLGIFSERLGNAIGAQSTRLLGADMVVGSPRPMAASTLAMAAEEGLARTRTVSFATMASAADRFQISSVKVVEGNYPLKGQMLLADAPFAEPYAASGGLQAGQLWVDARLLDALQLSLGDTIDIGDASLRIDRILVNEPGGVNSSFTLGPRLLMHADDLDRAAVVQAGSRVRYRYGFAGTEQQIERFRQRLESHLLPEHRVYTVTEGRPRVAGAIEKAQSYLLLGGALGVALAGAAIAIAVRRYTERHIQNVAVLKTLGASGAKINSIYLQKFTALLAVAIGLGFVLGWLIQAVIVMLISALADIQLEPAGWYPYGLGAATGLVCLFAFALPPLWALRQVSPLAALRKDVQTRPVAPVVSWLVGLGALFTLMVWYSGSMELAAAVFAGLLVSVVLVSVLAWLLIRSTRLVGSNAGNMWLLASSALRRRGLESAMQIVVFSITVMLFLVLLVTRSSLIGEWRQEIPEGTPNHFLVNVQPGELERLKSWMAQHQLNDAGLYPIVRGRLTHINGQQTQRRISADSAGTADLDRELALTSRAARPVDNALLHGHWWPADSKQNLVSIEGRLAQSLGVVLGDKLRFQVASEVFDVEVSSIREVVWENMRPNFYMIFPPAMLQAYPTTYMTSFYLPAARKPLLGEMVRAFPTLTVIEVDAIIRQIRTIIRQVSLAIEAILWVVMACGALVLIATVQSGMTERFRESSILRTLGAPARLVLGSISIEFLLLGLIAGVLAAAGAEATTWVLQERVFRIDWRPHPWLWLLGPLLSGILITVIGTLASRKAVTTPPVEVLRSL
jgi:putative ABC transport system permease protein